jgi:hypothetical protein
MKIWVDDIRTPPDGWRWCKDSESAIHTLQECEARYEPIELMSLDHDLGGDDTTRPIVLWMCENDFWPVEVVCHSANPVGIDWIEGMIERYKP